MSYSDVLFVVFCILKIMIMEEEGESCKGSIHWEAAHSGPVAILHPPNGYLPNANTNTNTANTLLLVFDLTHIFYITDSNSTMDYHNGSLIHKGSRPICVIVVL